MPSVLHVLVHMVSTYLHYPPDHCVTDAEMWMFNKEFKQSLYVSLMNCYQEKARSLYVCIIVIKKEAIRCTCYHMRYESDSSLTRSSQLKGRERKYIARKSWQGILIQQLKLSMSNQESPSKALALISCAIPCIAALSQGVLLTWLNPVLPQVK